jgi:hypothetical protein
MPRSHPPHLPECQEWLFELARAGHRSAELARESGPAVLTIQNWLKQADWDKGRRDAGLTTAEQLELVHLRRGIKPVRLERELLVHRPGVLREGPPPGSHEKLTQSRPHLRVRARQSDEVSCDHGVPTEGEGLHKPKG